MYAKAIVQVIAAILAAALPALLVDGPLGWSEWLNFGILAAGAIQVWNAANLPGYEYGKALASGVSACLVLLTSFLTDGLSTQEIVQVAIAFVVGVGGVVGVRNRGTEKGVFRSGRYAVSGGGYGGPLR